MSSDDKYEIINVLNLYALAVDTTRWDLFDLVFVPDVNADYGPSAHWRDLASFKKDFETFHDPFQITQHVITNHQVFVNADQANTLTYANARLVRHVPDGGDIWEGAGWYDDRLIRTAAGWRIKDRVCRLVWWTGNPRVTESTPGARFENVLTRMRDEAAVGKISYLDAIKGQKQ